MKRLFFVFAIAFSLSESTAQQWGPQTSGTATALASVWFTDGQHGWAVGDLGTSIVTTNGGQVWSAVPLTNQDLEDVTFLNASVGLMVGDDGLILRTVTGGMSWSIATSGTAANLRSAAFGDGGMAYIGGRDGVILRSTTAGETWTVVETGTVRYRGTAASGTQHAWIIGEEGTIRATTNSGTSWFPQSPGTGSDLHCVFFLTASEGWIGGANNTLLYTSDGGTTWTPRSTGITVGIDGIYFLNPGDGWAVGDAGLIFQTTNGGVQWSPVASSTVNHLNDVFFVDGTGGWAVGDAGSVIFRGAPTSVGDNTFTRPERASLGQNYPNPFNPSTVIRYTTAEPAHVAIRVFNLIGQQVATLVNGRHSPGAYTVNFAAEGLGTGVYLYKLELNGSTAEIRKMTVMR